MPQRAFVVLLEEIQQEGFLPGFNLEGAQKLWEQLWDCEPPESLHQTKVMLAALDQTRCWCRDLKAPIEPGLYAETLRSWLALVDPGLQLESLRESPGLLEYSLSGYRVPFRFDPQAQVLDMGLLRSLNDHLPGEGSLEVCDDLGMPNCVIFVRPNQKAFLESRGWKFLDHLSRFHENPPWSGYLGTYASQGLEDGPWSIFQRQSFCRSPKEGWDLLGMTPLLSGGFLKIFSREGHLLWEGRLDPCRKGWFGKVEVGKAGYHPSGVDLKSWQQWLYSDPPLRALYTPPGKR